jgi:hypothetical protein
VVGNILGPVFQIRRTESPPPKVLSSTPILTSHPWWAETPLVSDSGVEGGEDEPDERQMPYTPPMTTEN